MRIRFGYFSLLLISCLTSFVVQAQQAAPVVLHPDIQKLVIPGSKLEILEDTSRALTINDVIKPDLNQRFRTPLSTSKLPDIENLGSAYWIRFRIENSSETKKRWVLENMDPHIDQFSYYHFDSDSGGYIRSDAGHDTSFVVRDFSHKNFIFDLPFNKGASEHYHYVRVESHNHNPFLFKIQTYNYFTYYSLNEYYFLGIFYGIMGIMALYNILLFFSVREKLYIYYAIYVMSCILISLSEDGLGFQFVWSNNPALNFIFGDFKAIIFMVSLMLYSTVFLELKKRSPQHLKMLFYVTFGYVVYYLLVFWLVQDKQLSGILRSAFKIIPFILIYYVAIKIYRQGYTPARYFVLGYSVVFISIVFLIFRETGLLHWYDVYSVYSFNFGLVIETVILSLALGDRIKIIKQERENAQERIIEQLKENEQLSSKVNRELEEKVSERTVALNEKADELNQANAKLQEQAEQINQMNLMLDLDNRKLQTEAKQITKARVMSQKVDLDDFNRIYPTKESCLKFLAELKWSEGYSCKKCDHDKHCKGKSFASRRCTRCRYDESATAFTIFHRLKFPITKAFYMVFLIYESKEKVTSSELSEILDLRQSTCWNFSKKIQAAIDKNKRKPKSERTEQGWGAIVFEN